MMLLNIITCHSLSDATCGDHIKSYLGDWHLVVTTSSLIGKILLLLRDRMNLGSIKFNLALALFKSSSVSDYDLVLDINLPLSIFNFCN